MAIINKYFFNLKAITFCLFFCFSWHNSNGQELLKGKITDQHQKPISYASIGYFNNRQGAISDSNGEFNINKITGDSIKISFIGFQPKVILIESTTDLLKIQLEPDTTSLNEVVIQSRRKTNNTITIGHFIKEKVTTYSYKGHQELQRGIFIPNTPKVTGYIDEILFQLYDYKRKPVKLRIRVLSVHPVTGFPDEDLLLTENILVSEKFRKINKFSIKSHNIQMPQNGIWISFEWLPIDRKLTNDDIPNIDGNNKADRPYMMNNWKEIQWKPVNSQGSSGSFLVPGVSVKVSY